MADVNVTITTNNSVSVQTAGVGSGGALQFSQNKYSGDGGTGYTTLTANQMSGAAQIDLDYHFRAGSLVLFKNGVLMEKDVEYSQATNRSGFTLLVAVASSDKIEARYVNT